MPSCVADWYLACTFFQIESGTERPVVDDLGSLPDSLLYKAIGSFDLASLSVTSSLDNPSLYQVNPSTRHSNIIPGIAFFGEYATPPLITFCKQAPFLGFICLEIDKWLYNPSSGSPSGIDACFKLIAFIREKGPISHDDLAFYGGFGKAELLVLTRTDNCDDVWNFLNFLRDIRLSDCFGITEEPEKHFPVFTSTRTVPLISYEKIVYSENEPSVKGIAGNVSATISIECHSGFESYVANYFDNKNGYEVKNTVGANDITVKTLNHKNISELIEDILRFRSSWKLNYKCHVSTNTEIHWKYEPKSCKKAKIYELVDTKIDTSMPYSLVKSNPYLSNIIKHYLHRIESLFSDRSQISINSLQFIGDYIHQTLTEHSEALAESDYESVHLIEGALQELVDSIGLGLAQRLASSFDLSRSNNNLPLLFSDGTFTNLLSIETIINFLFEQWSIAYKEYNGVDNWIGFTVFSDNCGFKLRIGEVIYLPMAATYAPFSAEGNWLTITHELSHAIYNRLNITEKFSEQYNKVKDANFKGQIIERAFGPDREFDNEIFELFAHWFDYYHFYNCDLKLYLKSIWSSWMCLPIAHMNFIEYFFRSFVVYAFSDFDLIVNLFQDKKINKYNDHLNKSWDDHINSLTATNIQGIDKYITHLIGDKNLLLDLFQRFAVLLLTIFSQSKNDLFKNSINKPYSLIDMHADSICKGEIVVNGIDNPHLLFKEIWKKIYPYQRAAVSNACILSLKNRNILITE